MTDGRRNTRRGPHRVRGLFWAPPTLTAPRTVTVTEDPATRYISLNAGEDLLLSMPTVINGFSGLGSHDAIIEITGGRNVVLIGGHIEAKHTPTTTMTAAVGLTETVLPVDDTTGFPNPGALRVDGELIYYSGLTPSSFTGCTRDAGFYNDGAASSKTHAAGALVEVAESARQGIAFNSQTGTVHVEGLEINGYQNDGIRIFGADSTIVQLQNIRIGPTYSRDPAFNIDGHPDCIQIWRGCAEVRIDRATLMTMQGKALLNQSVGAFKTGVLRMRDVEAIGYGDNAPLFTNSDAATVVDAQNVWARPVPGKTGADPNMEPYVNIMGPDSSPPEFCPAGVPGVGYVSPGYL